jgi:hypothetical protein
MIRYERHGYAHWWNIGDFGKRQLVLTYDGQSRYLNNYWVTLKQKAPLATSQELHILIRAIWLADHVNPLEAK